jgi:hypothetical protein
MSQGEVLGAKKEGGSNAVEGLEDMPQLMGDMDALLRQHRESQTLTQRQMDTPKNNEQHVKQAQSVHPELRLMAIRDLKVQPIADEPAVTLIILHQCHLRNMVATDTKQRCVNVNIYRVGLARSAYGNKNKVVTSNPTFSLVESIQRLGYYTRQIITGGDLIYFVSPINIYAYRKERGTLTEVQTSAICKVVEDGIERRQENRLPPPAEQAYITQGPGAQPLTRQPLGV